MSLHYNGANSYLFINSTEIIKFKAKDSEIVATPSCLGNISKDFSVDNKKKTGLNGYACDFRQCYCSLWYIRDSQVLNEKEWYNKMYGFVWIKCLDLLRKCLL